MSRLRLSVRQQAQRTTGRRRSATFAAIAALTICPLAIAACGGGTNVSETAPKSTPEITAPTESGSGVATTKTESHSSSSTASEPDAGAEESTTEPEASETGGTETSEEEPASTGGEVAPTEATEPTEEEAAAGGTGGASAP